MRLAIVLGTRPEIIKMSPVIRAAERAGVDFYLLHTGQHYSYEMDRVFFEQLALPAPRHRLEAGSGTHGAQTGRMLAGVEAALASDPVDAVLVQGDTNTVVAGALAATKLHVAVGHVEAGLRSYDRRMPEEINRVVADHVSDHLFAPTEGSRAILLGEGLPEARVHVTGNTIVDAVLENRKLAAARGGVLKELGVSSRGYVLLTAHRQENVDEPARLRGLLEGARRAGETLGVPVVYPIHPRARKRLADLGGAPEGVRLVDPLDFLGFLEAEANARLILTDSGGVQEEACILGVPCVTLRDNTERPETVDVGANALAGTDPTRIRETATRMASAKGGWRNPFGTGDASERILRVLREALAERA